MTKKDPLNIALPKGRSGKAVYKIFERAGFACPDILSETRRLIFENETSTLRFFFVKPSDVAIYVQHSAADLGIVGRDILLEHSPDVYELLNFAVAKCRMSVSGPPGICHSNKKILRVATKFPNITKDYYASQSRDIDIIKLNGSIELAPILGLSDVIVDIVETGATLRENGLEELETITEISARLIANKASYKFKYDKINQITKNLAAILEK